MAAMKKWLSFFLSAGFVFLAPVGWAETFSSWSIPVAVAPANSNVFDG